MSTANLKSQVMEYGQIPENDAGWKREHRDAIACDVIRENIALGLTIFDALHRTGIREDVTVHDGVAVCELYEQWLQNSTRWLACASSCLRKGRDVPGATDLQENVWKVSSWLAQIKELRAELETVIGGGGTPLEKVLDGV